MEGTLMWSNGFDTRSDAQEPLHTKGQGRTDFMPSLKLPRSTTPCLALLVPSIARALGSMQISASSACDGARDARLMRGRSGQLGRLDTLCRCCMT